MYPRAQVTSVIQVGSCYTFLHVHLCHKWYMSINFCRPSAFRDGGSSDEKVDEKNGQADT